MKTSLDLHRAVIYNAPAVLRKKTTRVELAVLAIGAFVPIVAEIGLGVIFSVFHSLNRDNRSSNKAIRIEEIAKQTGVVELYVLGKIAQIALLILAFGILNPYILGGVALLGVVAIIYQEVVNHNIIKMIKG